MFFIFSRSLYPLLCLPRPLSIPIENQLAMATRCADGIQRARALNCLDFVFLSLLPSFPSFRYAFFSLLSFAFCFVLFAYFSNKSRKFFEWTKERKARRTTKQEKKHTLTSKTKNLIIFVDKYAPFASTMTKSAVDVNIMLFAYKRFKCLYNKR